MKYIMFQNVLINFVIIHFMDINYNEKILK